MGIVQRRLESTYLGERIKRWWGLPPRSPGFDAGSARRTRPAQPALVRTLGEPADRWRPITLRRRRQDMIDNMAAPLRMQPTEQKLPIEPMENADPIEPIDSTEPIEPIDRTDPREPMHSTESVDRSDSRDLDRRAGSCAESARRADTKPSLAQVPETFRFASVRCTPSETSSEEAAVDVLEAALRGTHLYAARYDRDCSAHS